MKRILAHLAACGALVALALAPADAHAGDKGKSKRSAFSQSGGGGGGGGGNSSMKLRTNSSRNFSGLSNNGPGASTFSGNTSLNKSFSKQKLSNSFVPTNQGNTNWATMNSGGKYGKSNKSLNSQITSGNLSINPSFNANGRARRASSGDTWNSNKFAEAIQSGNIKPIDSGIGNGTSPQSGKFKPWEHKSFVDAIKHGNNFPGNGNGNGQGPGYGDQFCDTPNKDKDCHNTKSFPWWTIGVGGCYPNNCHDYFYRNRCYAPIYYRYPPVTNVTVVNQMPPELPAQPALVEGVDLELLDLRLVDVGDAAKNLGPRYQITFRNRGRVPAGNFQVMLLASSDGTPKPGLPSGSAEISGLAPGQMLTADVRLTVTPDLATLGALVVALDSATQIVEFEEGNNVAVLDRSKILLADLATTGIQ